MILVLNKKATKQDIDQLLKRLEFMGFTAVPYQDSIAILKGMSTGFLGSSNKSN